MVAVFANHLFHENINKVWIDLYGTHFFSNVMLTLLKVYCIFMVKY